MKYYMKSPKEGGRNKKASDSKVSAKPSQPVIYNGVGEAKGGIFLRGRAFHSYIQTPRETCAHTHKPAFLHAPICEDKIKDKTLKYVCICAYTHLLSLPLLLPHFPL